MSSIVHTPAVFDLISDSYRELVRQDPSKRFVQYPWAIRQLAPRIGGPLILDIGCGEGALARILAKSGAFVCGYDNSIAQIEHAREREMAGQRAIQYIHADPRDIVSKCSSGPFDIAVAVTVLHYATDRDHLEAFFSSTRQLLRPGGFFAALVSNPTFKRFGQRLYNRRYTRERDGQLRVDFFDGEQIRCSALYSDFSRSDYESAARATGWPALEWLPVSVSTEGKENLRDFWDGFEEDCPYAGFKLRKPLI